MSTHHPDDRSRNGWVDKQKTILGEFTASYQEHCKRQQERDPTTHDPRFPGGRPVDVWAEDEQQPFDPDAVPTWMDQPNAHQMIPSVEKFLQRFARDDNDDDDEPKPYLWVSHGYIGDPIAINFQSPHRPSRSMKFRDLRALERWVLAHKQDIECSVRELLFPKRANQTLG